MFATNLSYDGSPHDLELSPENAESAIADAIATLNGLERSLVTVGTSSPAHLAIGGDAAQKLVVYVTFDNKAYQQPIDPTAPANQKVTVVAGGQPGVYPATHAITCETATRAAQVFAMTGELAEDLTWVKT